MAIDALNNQRVITSTAGAAKTEATSKTGATSKTAGSNTLSMDDFFSLMVAQLSNQDMYNTMDNTQFIAQMAQFSMVQALTNLSEASATSYGVSLIGKEVTLAKNNDDGTLSTTKGIVESVNLYNGKTELMVDGKTFQLSNVMSVSEPKIIIPQPPKEGEQK